jgi:APA family basic amino acid/polyamine antiporter
MASLRRSLSLFDLIMIAVGSTIGSGIFLTPAMVDILKSYGGWQHATVTAVEALSVFLFRRRMPNADRPYKTAGYPGTPVIFLTVALLFVLNTMFERPMESGIGLGFLALGVPVYYFGKGTFSKTQ